jgi:hypothetical protein
MCLNFQDFSVLCLRSCSATQINTPNAYVNVVFTNVAGSQLTRATKYVNANTDLFLSWQGEVKDSDDSHDGGRHVQEEDEPRLRVPRHRLACRRT